MPFDGRPAMIDVGPNLAVGSSSVRLIGALRTLT